MIFLPATGQFTGISLEPINVVKCARAARDTFAEDYVQLEGDYFSLNKIDASWGVGHVRVSDYGQKYWPITY